MKYSRIEIEAEENLKVKSWWKNQIEDNNLKEFIEDD